MGRPKKRATMLVGDALMMAFVVWAAFALRMGEGFSVKFYQFWYLHLLLPAISLPLFYISGMYNSVLRHMGPSDVWSVVRGVTLSTLAFILIVVLGDLVAVPRTTLTIYWLIGLLFIGGSRFLVRAWHQHYARSRGNQEPVAIYGAGAAGLQLVSSLMATGEHIPVAFIDDNRQLHGTLVRGVPVYPPSELDRLIRRLSIHSVLVALPSVSRQRRRSIIKALERYPVHVRTIPSMTDLVTGSARLRDVREVDIEDLLGRDPVDPDQQLLEGSITGRSVMVTGAGGSIGGELCRQIIQLRPRRLAIFERSELALYRIDRELRALAKTHGHDCEIIPLLGSVVHRRRMTECMRNHGIETVYHAAAYKHVPLVEANPLEGIRNNAFGTWHTAAAAEAAGVRSFVLISTDKAVRPTSIMGATKRIAELGVQALAAEASTTVYSMVRFGNVLDSSGSVIPLFREQIREGGPVTITHPDVTRYFMTIPEAASLVIQAGSLAKGGEVFVLDMGEPVRIHELARRMIQLSGFTVRDRENPHGDIPIEYIGLRPGEKLFEELLLGENCEHTDHPMIQRAREECLPVGRIVECLECLETACREQDVEAAERMLGECVVGFERQDARDSFASLTAPTSTAVINA
ncbi:hypothetical protein SPICUR_09120 [Spiribacter curvatus]|uniref:Polysaccharide biosynthesis protein CapD-like domain-containing protein n=1 Tax=Spiribacter curvatus TaxID=1335757 RepID=U5T5M0_9GAMM|nr:nucleoside-diphosphate sugar epimerase/dehydratase [Spiribacter curvatus]AGY92745.1 hypothetical protein SPICUR_09120 [Spiribacter curvatus]